MDVAVVFESMFGNTQEIAEAVADGLRGADPGARVTVLPVAQATPDRIGGAALVVGAPTHVLGLSRTPTRRKAMETAGTGEPPAEVVEFGVREWLDTLPGKGSRRAAVFDTRLASPFAGGAARHIDKGLRRHGYTMVARPKGFVVDSGEGPLRAGEHERARTWGADLAHLLAG
ncbi:MAG TPA: flavodoxin family protein [Rugosimonospora sp.]|nr:flavodoxin family protein [Rugosimonospora sp.]